MGDSAAVDTLVERVAEWVQQHYADRITARAIAAALGRHPAYLGSMFRQLTGLSVPAYVTGVRMEHAAELIERGEKIEAVSLCIGYRSKTSFYRRFKQHFGMTPGAYRARAGGRRQA